MSLVAFLTYSAEVAGLGGLAAFRSRCTDARKQQLIALIVFVGLQILAGGLLSQLVAGRFVGRLVERKKALVVSVLAFTLLSGLLLVVSTKLHLL